MIYNLKYYLKIIAYLASVNNNNQIFMFLTIFYVTKFFKFLVEIFGRNFMVENFNYYHEHEPNHC